MADQTKHVSELIGTVGTITNELILYAHDLNDNTDKKFPGSLLVNNAGANVINFGCTINGVFVNSISGPNEVAGDVVVLEAYASTKEKINEIVWVFTHDTGTTLTYKGGSVTPSFSMEGSYDVTVTAYSINNNALCTTTSFTYFGVSAAPPTPSYSLTVNVKDSLTNVGNYLEGVKVVLSSTSSAYSGTSYTNVSGDAIFTNLQSGNYTVTASLANFLTGEIIDFTLAPDTPQYITLGLDPLITANLITNEPETVLTLSYTFLPDSDTYEGLSELEWLINGTSVVTQIKGDSGYGILDITGQSGIVTVQLTPIDKDSNKYDITTLSHTIGVTPSLMGVVFNFLEFTANYLGAVGNHPGYHNKNNYQIVPYKTSTIPGVNEVFFEGAEMRDLVLNELDNGCYVEKSYTDTNSLSIDYTTFNVIHEGIPINLGYGFILVPENEFTTVYTHYKQAGLDPEPIEDKFFVYENITYDGNLYTMYLTRGGNIQAGDVVYMGDMVEFFLCNFQY